MNDAKSIEADQIIEHLEKEPKFDVLKTREGYFRKYDHQLMHEMYAVEALKANELKNQWDIYKPSAPVPGCQRAARRHRGDGRKRTPARWREGVRRIRMRSAMHLGRQR